MRLKNILILVVLLAITFSVMATPTLARDNNSEAIQACRTFTAVDSLLIGVTAPVNLWNSIAVPSNAVYATCIAAVGAVSISSATSVSTGATKGTGILCPVGVPVKIPVMGNTYIYYRRAVAATAATLYIIWEKM